jgi:hypothetical protein
MNTVSVSAGEFMTGGDFFSIWSPRSSNRAQKRGAKPQIPNPKSEIKLTLLLQKAKISLLLFYPNKNLSLYKEFSNIE